MYCRCRLICNGVLLKDIGFILTCILAAVAIGSVNRVSAQEFSHLNTPPILVVSERNWRIVETEPVGQIIARVRADDSENDDLLFGLESKYNETRMPFRIDPIGGVVYLNESLIGRGGENFFLYITVNDGKSNAKSEIFVNILSAKDSKNRGRGSPPISLSNIIHNMSFFPSFDRLPGVQSIRNQQPNRKPQGAFQNGGIYSLVPQNNYPPLPVWASSGSDNVNNNYDTSLEDNTMTSTMIPPTSSMHNRTKLTPIPINSNTSYAKESNVTESKNSSNSNPPTSDTSQNAHDIRSQVVLGVFIACGIFLAVGLIMGVVFRKLLCAFGLTLKKKSKEELAKKSNPSNLSITTSTDDSRTSMDLQHWNGPIACRNRYVPWEREHQVTEGGQHHQMNDQSTVSQFTTDVTGLGNPSIPHAAPLGGPRPSVDVNARSGNNAQEQIDTWEFPRHRLKFFNIIGEGAFGQVWRCEITDSDRNESFTTVAVKTLKENATEFEKKDLLSELEVMKSLDPHVNVVRLLGCCTDKDPIFVIIEYVSNGKLQTFLRNSRAERHYGNTHGKSNVLTSGDLTSFMYQVAKGMDYLTSRGIIHRDLAARNILITDDHTCKVADFGFARDVVTSKIYERKSEGKLPIRWMAIESLYDNLFSAKSDIWSFGVLMWEIVTLGSTPYPGISASDVMRKVRDGYRLEKPEHCRRELYNIMYYCWSQDPSDRPSFSELVQMLDKLLHTEMDYIELERFPDHNYYNILSLSGEKV